MTILAIDPGNIQSGYAVIEMPNFKLLDFGKIDNDKLLKMLQMYQFDGWQKINKGFKIDVFAIEKVASYGMPVGKDVFDTCEWIGQFTAIYVTVYAYADRCDD